MTALRSDVEFTLKTLIADRDSHAKGSPEWKQKHAKVEKAVGIIAKELLTSWIDLDDRVARELHIRSFLIRDCSKALSKEAKTVRANLKLKKKVAQLELKLKDYARLEHERRKQSTPPKDHERRTSNT